MADKKRTFEKNPVAKSKQSDFWFSVVMITHNERENIEQSVPPLLSLTDDVVIIDGASTDGTIEVAQQLGATVIQLPWEGYAKTKNEGNARARYDWILSIDADEVVSEALVKSLQQLAPPSPQQVFALDRITNYCGQWIKNSNWYPDWKIRLFHRKEVQWKGDYVHETLNVPAHFKVKKLSGYLYHYSYKSSADHWARMEKYAQLAAQELYAKGKKANVVKQWISPVARFIKTYFIKNGWRDGKAGWTIATRNAWLVWRKYQLLREQWQSK